jgi:hypothetical protein
MLGKRSSEPSPLESEGKTQILISKEKPRMHAPEFFVGAVRRAAEGYRVILKSEGDEIEIGSISIQHSAGAQFYWKWAIDTVIPMRTHQTQGRGTGPR